MQIIPSDLNIDFLGQRKVAAVASAIAIVLSLSLVFAVKGVNLGIDFTGGVETQIRLDNPTGIEKLRAALNQQGFDASVQSFGDVENVEYLVRAPLVDDVPAKEVSDQIHSALVTALEGSGVHVDRTEVVGPKVGEELRTQGILSICYALVGIFLYVVLRFKLLGFALGAIAALVHDVTIVIGIFSLLGVEINLPIIAALLTIIGYSLNDTVVVFDRIRENRNRNRRSAFLPVINNSINETLSRTVLTSVTTLITVIALLLLTQAGTVIHSFALALLAGVLVGTYSSVFVASPVLLAWENRSSNA